MHANSIKVTSTKRLIEARLGQGKYRTDLEKIWEGRCAVTGCRTGAALRASHIKSWAISTDIERLDKYNGLLLIATLDALFDNFRISFSDTGEMLVSKYLPENEHAILGVYGALRKIPNAEQSIYLADHRLRFQKKEIEIDESTR
ncbi:HNH endonuclease [Collimonas humicola]|uniref:HNH endonuclease n=1 Tax=Collimonas humicola TaxID=2825886 RepID=UPI001B8B5049|nr:HNH endonuclease [Collimonas humicola]